MKKLLFTFALLLSAGLIIAQTTFTSVADGDWDIGATWDQVAVPGATDNVVIASGHTVYRTANTTVGGDLTIEADGNLDLSGYTLAITGTVLIESDVTGTGEVWFDNTAGTHVTATVERFIDASGWHQISFGGDPGNGEIPYVFNTIKANVVYQDNAPDVWIMRFIRTNPLGEWNFITDLNEDLDLFFGYAVLGDADFTFSYTESMTSDDETLADPGANKDYWAPLTNPYPTSYEVFKGGTTIGTGLYDRIWVWDPNFGTGGDYRMFNGSTGDFSGLVARGQSFFVQASVTGTATYDYDADYRDFGSNNFFKNGSNDGWSDNFGTGTYVMFKVKDHELGENNAFVSFGENGTTGDDNGFDVPKFFGGSANPQLYLVEEDLNLGIDHLSTLKEAEERVVKMNIEPGITGEHTLAANIESLPNTQVTLEDTKLGILHDFNNEEQYTFIATPEDDSDRFLVHFMYSPTGIEDPAGDNSSISVYAYNKAIYISNSVDMTEQSEIKIYDLIGREIYSAKTELSGSTRIPVNVSNTYLVVKVIQENNVTTEKVFVK